jgi:hypothetical protein
MGKEPSKWLGKRTPYIEPEIKSVSTCLTEKNSSLMRYWVELSEGSCLYWSGIISPGLTLALA